MDLQFLQSFLFLHQEIIFHLSIISSLYFIIWARICGREYSYCIDDISGIAAFNQTYDAKQNKVIDSYELETGKDKDGKPIKKSVRYLSYIKELGFPGALLRFSRLNIGKKFKEIAKNSKGHPVYGYVQDPARHHFLSLITQYFNLILSYFFISKLFGNHLAFLTVLLFSMNPVSGQTVAWISGVNYLFSLFGALAVFNVSVYFHNYYLTLPLVFFFSSFSSFTLLTGGFTWIPLLFLGRYWEAFTSFSVSLIILWKAGNEVVSYRKAQFKEQNMERPTKFNKRKPIFMVKTFWYYLRMSPLPMRLGLFHEDFYHYDDKVEHTNKDFWLGFLSIIAITGSFCFLPFPLKFGILWFTIYLIPFLNVITAQQAVVDRYVFIPSLGMALIFSFLLKSHLYVFFFLLGLYAMRILLHIPSFKNEKEFYFSNFLNFRKSEVALGNLGVTLMNEGYRGMAVDTWTMATKINEFYDVPWYNLYSIFKGEGYLEQAYEFLKKCLNGSTVHFYDTWTKELKNLEREIQMRKGFPQGLQRMNQFYKEIK